MSSFLPRTWKSFQNARGKFSQADSTECSISGPASFGQCRWAVPLLQVLETHWHSQVSLSQMLGTFTPASPLHVVSSVRLLCPRYASHATLTLDSAVLTKLGFVLYLLFKLRSRSSIFIITRIGILPYGSFQKFHMTIFFVLELISCCTGISLKLNPTITENHLVR